MSDRDNEIFIVNRQGEIQLRLTDIVSNDLWNNEQHGHHLLEHSIILFANSGSTQGGFSAVIEYSLSDGSELFRYDRGVSSVCLGDVERLPNGNTLVTFSIAGVIHEEAPSGNLVREITETSMG